ncbi:MAG: hypothetical protein M3Y41_12875 [Pseudomonadota bacterium]|nr:hypothetical protein [Pseudomonadota bacterium]
MSERATAEIIAFPRQCTLRQSTALDGRARLEQALARLQDALALQAAAVTAWQDALRNLHGRISGLGASMARYDASLHPLGSGVAALHAEAGRLESWADAALRS